MRTLVINGSPKADNSNTMCLTKAFLKGMGLLNDGNPDVKIVDAYHSEIKPCRGCFACWNKTPGKCVISDGMSEIFDQIISADVIIWSFPLYYYSVPSTVKNLLDRLLPMNLPFMSSDNESGGHLARFDLSHQRHVVISTCGFWTAQGNYEGVEAIFDHMYGKGNYDKIFCGQGELFHIPELRERTGAYLEIVSRGGEEFRRGKISKELYVNLAEPLFERNVFEKMADASWGISEETESSAPKGFSFTKQMAALYVPDDKERVLELEYTDIGETYQMILTAGGSSVIKDNFKPYTTRIETPFDVWQEIARGEISGQEALFQRKYKVQGDFDLMLRWDELFNGTGKAAAASVDKAKKTNMLILLIPWIIIWIALPINAKIGGIVGITAASLVPLLWSHFRAVVYERITIPVVIGLSLLALSGVSTQLIIPISYCLFGIMWFVTSFLKIPLTAHYSSGGYGDDRAFANPLFIKTNAILTGAWGILYVLTSAWTFCLMGTAVSPYVGLINSAVPLLMGAFTLWFEKWYPAHFAARDI